MRSLGPGIARGVDFHLVWRSVGRLPLANAPASGTLPAPCLRHPARPFCADVASYFAACPGLIPDSSALYRRTQMTPASAARETIAFAFAPAADPISVQPPAEKHGQPSTEAHK